jgi:elongation factor Ts
MELIKQLREMTGAGMVDCQKALKETGNDLEKAVEFLRKKGIAKAAKRTDREAKEGVVKVGLSADKKTGYILELNSETDFVSRNERFQNFADSVLAVAQAANPENLETLLGLKLKDGSVQEDLDSLSGTIGEKLAVKRYESLAGETVAAYSHLGGRLGVLVALDQPGKEELAMDIAMQIAAANPKYLVPADVDPAEMDREKEIYKEQLLKEGKPAEMVEKIVAGKMGKYYSEVCLVEQEYIKDDKKKIKDILGGANILKFVRYSL